MIFLFDQYKNEFHFFQNNAVCFIIPICLSNQSKNGDARLKTYHKIVEMYHVGIGNGPQDMFQSCNSCEREQVHLQDLRLKTNLHRPLVVGSSNKPIRPHEAIVLRN